MQAKLNVYAPRAASYVLAEAVLIYRESGADAARAYASIHTVDVTEGRPTILAGKPMTPRAAHRLARELCRQNASAAATFLDGRTLYSGSDLLVWWHPPTRRHIAFRCPELGERGEVVPHPALVFAVGATGWRVWALQGHERPVPTTRLYRAPYFNVSDHGVICQGSTAVPTGDAVNRLDAWNDAFFGSFFAHPNGSQTVRHPGGAYAFWKSMLDKPPSRFPQRALLPTGATLADTLAMTGGRDD
ncbi:MAG: PRTRC system protein B [Burkholderiaceae bacterium]|nr:PRTRC system protein B [Burkholderiaceae bacterium]